MISLKKVHRRLLLIILLLAIPILFIYLDEQRQQRLILECNQLIPQIEAFKIASNYPSPEQLAAYTGADELIEECHYRPLAGSYTMTIPGKFLNFSLFYYMSSHKRWRQE